MCTRYTDKTLVYWRQRADERLYNPLPRYRGPFNGQRQGWKTRRWAWSKQVHGMRYFFTPVLWRCRLGDGKDIRPVKSLALVWWWWRFDWSFARLVRTTSIILSSSKIQEWRYSGTGLPTLSWKMVVKRMSLLSFRTKRKCCSEIFWHTLYTCFNSDDGHTVTSAKSCSRWNGD